jgi:hypothetical protein
VYCYDSTLRTAYTYTGATIAETHCSGADRELTFFEYAEALKAAESASPPPQSSPPNTPSAASSQEAAASPKAAGFDGARELGQEGIASGAEERLQKEKTA